MISNETKILSSKSINQNYLQNDNNIPYPLQRDKNPLEVQNNNSYIIHQLKDIQALHQNNIYNYKKGNICKLVYSEEEYKNENKYISYDKLIDLINIKEPFDKNAYKNFKYKNYNKDNELLFSSKFESGNLRYAIKLSNNEYDLILRPETNSMRTYHWFFFRVEINNFTSSDKLNKNKIVKFNIINLYKKTILFNENVKILSYYNNGWSRDTFDIHYFSNDIPNQMEINRNNVNNNINFYDENDLNDSFISSKTGYSMSTTTNTNMNLNISNNFTIYNENFDENNLSNDEVNSNNKEEMKYHTLTFSFDFSNINTNEKYVYFAYCYPYSFTQLCKYLSSLNNYKDILRLDDQFGRSLEGNLLYILIITDFTDSFDKLADKKAIIFTSRVHPGESNGSYVIQGVIDFLLSNDPSAKNLRKNFIFKIIPMLNPDGVIRGNFRMNILGKDLNRMWDEPVKNICPTIFNAVEMIKKTLNSRDIYFFCDFHGHSNKNNFFLYSCKHKSDYLQLDEKTFIKNPQKNKLTYYELVFQNILNQENNFLDEYSCSNKILQSKMQTSRAILKNIFKVDFSYCLESSIASMRTKEGILIPFTINQYKKIGRDFCISLNKLIAPKIFFSVLSSIRANKKEKYSYYSKKYTIENFLLPPYNKDIIKKKNKKKIKKKKNDKK